MGDFTEEREELVMVEAVATAGAVVTEAAAAMEDDGQTTEIL